MLAATAAQARGAVELATGHALNAMISLRQAWQVWQQIDAPYLAARTRALMGKACHAMGDKEGAGLELDAARLIFEKLQARPDLEQLQSFTQGPHAMHGLTRRELQVLQLIAAGKTNKAIANELSLSEKTIDRHVSNILMKLDVPSRAAATAQALKLRLL